MNVKFKKLKSICKYNNKYECCENKFNTSYNTYSSCSESLCPLKNQTKNSQMLNETQIAKVMLQYCKELVEKRENKDFDYDHIMLIGIICGLLTSLNRIKTKEKIQEDILGHALDVITEILKKDSAKIK